MTTKWAFEVPVQHLRDFDEDQDFIFALSFLFNRELNPFNWDYTEYLNNIGHQGLKTIWIDNSYNELGQADDKHLLLHLYRTHRPQMLITPDDPSWDSFKIGYEFQEFRRHTVPTEDLMVVVQNFEMYSTLVRGGAMHFATPYDTREKNFTTEQLESIPSLHFLGFNDPEEIHAVRPTSCDTGMPIKLALQGRTSAKWLTEGCSHIHNKDLGKAGCNFFQAKMTQDQIKLAKDNINHLKEVCKWTK